MINLGVIYNDESVKLALPSVAQLAGMKHEVNVIFYTNSNHQIDSQFDNCDEYTPIYCNSIEELVQEADIILVGDARGLEIVPKTSKIILTAKDVHEDYSLIIPYLNQKIDVFVFHENFQQHNQFIHHTTKTSQLVLSFLRFYLGEPIPSHEIQLIGQAKVVERGKLVHKRLLHLIDQY